MAELKLRTSSITTIRRIYERVRLVKPETYDIFQVEQELRSLSAHFERFVTNHNRLVAESKNDEVAAHDLLWQEVEEIYNSASVMLQRLKAATKTLPATEALQRTFDLKLDPLAIPTFDGTLHTWLAFKEAFETLVDKVDFPDAYKLGKLRQAVHVSAVPLIGGVYSGGYAEVWKALKDRFDNKKQLAEIHTTRFINLQPSLEETSSSLLIIVDTVRESLRALRVMGLPVDQWDALAVPIVVSKLPAITQREWSLSSSPCEISSLEDLLKFVEKRSQSLNIGATSWPIDSGTSKQVVRTTARPAPRLIKSNVASLDVSRCAHCQGPHRIMRCPSLMALKAEQRFEALKNSGLCYNCLKSGHSSKQCTSGGCRQCGRKHNTIFCRNPAAYATSSATTQLARLTSTSQLTSQLTSAPQPTSIATQSSL